MMKFLLSIFGLLCASFLYAESNQNLFLEVQLHYQNGLKASSWQERLTSFNTALEYYVDIVKDEGANAEVNQSIGDLFFELQEYPWAILYYERAQKESYGSQLLSTHLIEVQKKLGIETAKTPPDWRATFIAHNLPQKENLRLFFWISLISLGLGLVMIWLPLGLLNKAMKMTAGLALLFLINYFTIFYLSPIEAILISPTGLYREPNRQQAQLSPIPLRAGMKVRVIDTSGDGYWLKIIDAAGQLGYLPCETLRII